MKVRVNDIDHFCELLKERVEGRNTFDCDDEAKEYREGPKSDTLTDEEIEEICR